MGESGKCELGEMNTIEGYAVSVLVLDTYIKHLYCNDYEKALSVLTPDVITHFKDSLIQLSINTDPVDNPAFIISLTTMGASCNLMCFFDAMGKPKTFYSLLYELKLKPKHSLLLHAIRNKKRIASVLLIEYFGQQSLMPSLSRAKQATYALLASHKTFGKDVTRIIAKLVWGSRANVNWE
jgi:hypothetical protein